jgi:hypothetical protein
MTGSVRAGWRNSLLVGVAVLGVLVLAIWKWPRPVPAPPTPSEEPERPSAGQPPVVYPTTPELLRQSAPLEWMRRLQDAAWTRQRFSVVRFVPDAEGQPSDTGDLQPSATRIRGVGFGRSDVLDIRGTFSEVKDLQFGFKDLGHVKQPVPVTANGGGPNYYRLCVLLLAQPDQPVLALAVSENRSTSITNAHLFGPLTDSDPELLAELMPWLQKPRDGVAKEEAESLLSSPNPWLVWLGLQRLEAQKALRTAHFRGVIERRPAAEAEFICQTMVWAASELVVRVDLMETLEAVLRLPGKQVPMLRYLARDIKINSRDLRRNIDVPRLKRWANSYREEIADDPLKEELVEALDQLLNIL